METKGTMSADGITGISLHPPGRGKALLSHGVHSFPLSSLGLLLCHLSASEKLSHFQSISVGEGAGGLFFFFSQKSYFKAVLPLSPAPGLLCLVLVHSRCGRDGAQGLCWTREVPQGMGSVPRRCLHPGRLFL